MEGNNNGDPDWAHSKDRHCAQGFICMISFKPHTTLTRYAHDVIL